MTRRIILLTFLLVGIALIELGCRNDEFKSASGPGCKDELHAVTGIDTIFVEARTGNRLSPLKTEQVSWKRAVLQFRLSTNQLVEVQHPRPSMAMAYALSPPICDYALTATLDRIYVYQYDSTKSDHKGANVTDHCQLVSDIYVGGRDSTQLDRLNEFGGYSLNFRREYSTWFDYHVTFFEKPILGKQQMLVELVLSNGTRHVAVSPMFTITE